MLPREIVKTSTIISALACLTLVGLEAEYRLRVSVTSSARLQTALHADPFTSGEKPLYRRKALEKGRAAV